MALALHLKEFEIHVSDGKKSCVENIHKSVPNYIRLSFDNWQEEFVTCNKLNIQNLVWVIDSPTIFTNPLLDYNKISNIISNSKKYNVNIIGVILLNISFSFGYFLL